MKILRISVLISALLSSACSSIDPVLVETIFPNPNTYGYTRNDPCIKCGESFIFLPNEEFGAQKQRRAERAASTQTRPPMSN
jgi:hypothetical protein